MLSKTFTVSHPKSFIVSRPSEKKLAALGTPTKGAVGNSRTQKRSPRNGVLEVLRYTEDGTRRVVGEAVRAGIGGEPHLVVMPTRQTWSMAEQFARPSRYGAHDPWCSMEGRVI